jgi:hypothetical protein
MPYCWALKIMFGWYVPKMCHIVGLGKNMCGWRQEGQGIQ